MRIPPKTLVLSILALALCAELAFSNSARHEKPTGRAETVPDYLTPYERKVLTSELNSLTAEIRTKRQEASNDESLAPLKQALLDAKNSGDAKKVEEAKMALNDAVETILYKDETIPPKIRRLHEVGRLLEYDTRKRKEQRARRMPGSTEHATAEASGN